MKQKIKTGYAVFGRVRDGHGMCHFSIGNFE